MESNLAYEYQVIIKQIKSNFECKFHLNNLYIAFCSDCKLNICEKCLNNNMSHIGHKIFYFKKMFLTEKQANYYKKSYLNCKYYLNKIREIVIELLIDLSDSIKSKKYTPLYTLVLKKLKNQLKNTYKFFHKMNTYQMNYFINILSLYFYCRKWGYFNYQLIDNIYNIKINDVKIPSIIDKDISKRAYIMIEFLKKSKNTNILKSSDSHSLTAFYSNKNNNNNAINKANTYKAELNSILFNKYQGEIFGDDDNSIFSYESTDISENNCIKENKEKIDVNTNKEVNNSSKVKKEDKLKNINNINNNNNPKNENNSKINDVNIIESYKISKMNEEFNSKKNKDNDKKIKINIKETKNTNKIKIEKENKENDLISSEKIKKYLFNSFSKSCKEQVEYRNVNYIYLDKVNKKEINCQYHGEFKKGTLKRHGRGMFIWEDGEYYIGYWANDKREGEGTNSYSNGNIYKGSFKNGKKDGDGIYKWSNGDSYQGKWKNDMMHGKGRYEFSNGDVYDGYFKKDKINGIGTYICANKKIYKGKFKNNSINNYVNVNE